MLTPAATTTTYYKIGEDVTFVWNYTSLLVTPTAIDVIATNAAGTWTLTSNASVKETGSLIWHTEDDATTNNGQNPLLTDSYTLVVFDAKAGVTAVPSPGYLSPYQNFVFGMYSPAARSDIPFVACVTCNGALSAMERQAVGFLLGMCAITVLSFTWFAGGFLGGF